MAEVGIAAALIGITGAATIFGSTTSAAREQVDYIAKNVSFYSDVLELLSEQFEHDRPIHSKKAIALAEKLHGQTLERTKSALKYLKHVSDFKRWSCRNTDDKGG